MSDKVTGPTACQNEGCAGGSGAEPQAWGTGHEEGYALRWPGHRQEADRRSGGGGFAQGRGSLLGPSGEHAGIGRPAGQEAGTRWPRTGRVLRSRAVRLWPVSPPDGQTRRAMPGRGSVDDASAAGRSGQDEPARRAEAGQAASGRRTDGSVGAGWRARGAARSGARPLDGGVWLDALPRGRKSIGPGWPRSSSSRRRTAFCWSSCWWRSTRRNRGAID